MKKFNAKENVKLKMKSIITKTIISIILITTICLSNCNTSKAATSNDITSSINMEDKTELTETIKNLVLTISSEGMTKEILAQTINLYTKATENYSNVEIAEMIDDCKKELVSNGVSTSDIDSVNNVLKNIDETQLKKVLNKINIDDIAVQIENGDSFQKILNGITANLSTTEKINLVFNLLLSAYVIKTVIIIIVALFIYRTLLRCVIYKKAGKRAWTPFIPLYRNIVMLKICGMNPWWLLLLLIPIVGWAFLWVLSVASKFMLAEAFGKKTGFAFGLWLLAPIFETIIVCSWKTKYIGFTNEDE